MACTITSVFLIAMFGIAAAVALRPGTKEKPSARQQETPVAPGPVRNVVGIRSGIISDKLIIPYYAARSNC
jgi:hypothetical protein